MEVDTIMTRGVVIVAMDQTLAYVRDLFEQLKFHHLVVVEEGRVVGVVSDRDLLRNLSPFVGKPSEREIDHRTLERRVHQIMTRGVVSVAPETDACEAARLLLKHRVSCLPVLDARRRCCGIVTLRDIVRWSLTVACGTETCPVDRRAA